MAVFLRNLMRNKNARKMPTNSRPARPACLLVALLLSCALLQSLPRGEPAKASKQTTLIRMEHVGNCPDAPDLDNSCLSSEIYPMGKTLFGRGVFEFRKNYTRLTKCADRNDPHCETFQNWRFGDETCNLLTMKNMIWTPLFNLHPALSCPVKAGVYRLENITVDLQRLKVINFPEKGYWKVSLSVDGDNIAKILCYYFEATFIRVRI